MMELIDFYNSIENPINDNKVISEIIRKFALSKDNDDFYSSLEEISGYKDSSYTFCHPYMNEDFDKLFDLLMQDGYREDLRNIRNGDYWVHIRSSGPLGKNINHRLYLNVDYPFIGELLYMFVSKCFDKDVPYYFKFPSFKCSRSDILVFYTSDDYILDFINILKEIRQEVPQIMSKIDVPPILSGKIDGWIGYGAEPHMLPNGELTSYNLLRCELIEKSILDTTNDWIRNNKKYKVDFLNEKVSIKTYLSVMLTREIVSACLEQFDGKFLLNNEQKEDVYNFVLSNFDNFINLSDFETYYNFDESNSIAITSEFFVSAVKKLIKYLPKLNPNYVSDVKKQIIYNCPSFGIDENNFCFNDDSKEIFEQISYQENTGRTL